MTADESEIPKWFRRIADRAGPLVTPRMLYGDTSGGWFGDAPVYPPVGTVLERDETPVHVIPMLAEKGKAAAFVPTDRRLYLVRGIRGHRGPRTNTTTVPFGSIRQIRTLGEEGTTGVKLMLDGSDGRATVPSDEGPVSSELSIGLHEEADPGEAARAVSYVVERRDGSTERPSGDQAEAADAAGGSGGDGTAAAGADGDVVERLAELASLRERGAITDDEFERLKRDVLDGDGVEGSNGGESAPPEASSEATSDPPDEPQGTLREAGSDDSGPVAFELDPPDRLTRHQTYYERLGLPDDLVESAAGSAIEGAYERACGRIDEPQQFRLLEEAYEVLSDPERRARYDATTHHEFVRNN